VNTRAPSPLATHERARRLANTAVWTAQLQRRRLATDEPEDGEFLFRRWADFQFFIVALTRVRRAAVLAAKVPSISDDMQKAIKEFDATLPMLKNMRDVAEHFDDYALDKGRLKAVRRQALEVGVIGSTIFQWLCHELNADTALKAAQNLFREIAQARP
jgi:hypothetical protein